jgi:hypothetical protein
VSRRRTALGVFLDAEGITVSVGYRSRAGDGMPMPPDGIPSGGMGVSERPNSVGQPVDLLPKAGPVTVSLPGSGRVSTFLSQASCWLDSLARLGM